MQLIVTFNNREILPEINELVAIMWKKDVNFSKVGNAASFKKCTSFTLSWDKWLDDKRWLGHNKFKEYIYFTFLDKEKNFKGIEVEVADDAILVDKRAFLKAAIYIAEKADGKISNDGIAWMTPEEFSEMNNETLKYSFEEAAEASLSS